jgi:hypothetical protein
MNGPTLDRLAKSGLSEDDIRSMRKLTMDQLKAKYPNMNPSTLRGIMTGETYSHIKD